MLKTTLATDAVIGANISPKARAHNDARTNDARTHARGAHKQRAHKRRGHKRRARTFVCLLVGFVCLQHNGSAYVLLHHVMGEAAGRPGRSGRPPRPADLKPPGVHQYSCVHAHQRRRRTSAAA
jgi:hypothetical protein